jgi:acetyl esterase/lipase
MLHISPLKYQMLIKVFLRVALFVLSFNAAYAHKEAVIELWPQDIPGQTEAKAEPVLTRDLAGISKVTNPVLVVYPANPEQMNGTAVIICPGGSYRLLAMDKEGYEVAELFSNLGYTAFVLEYRVPDNRLGALQDVQRAVRYVRGSADQWGIKPNQIGLIGFSAGGSLSTRASTRYSEKLYEPIDAFDSLSARPDFTALIYPAYLDQGEGHSLTPELKLDKNTPPFFMFLAADDYHGNSGLVLGASLRAEGIPFELHVLPSGGHGFGIRPGIRAANIWPQLCHDWIQLVALK